jgi:hypothetical protein
VTTAIDTNVLLDVLLPNPAFYESSASALRHCANEGVLIICETVLSELSAHFEKPQPLEQFLHELDILTVPMGSVACFDAGRIWRIYRKNGGKRTRMMSDFIIGAHARFHADLLLSRDRGFYKEFFPSLRILDPSAD